MTVLLFTDGAERFAELENTMVLTAGSINHEDLRDVDKLKDGADFKVFVTSLESMMRGIDYRSKTGICLIANKSFTSYRALAQGMSRVGRFNDHCERLFVYNVKEVDEAIF